MPVDVDQAFEPQLARPSDAPISVAIVAAEGPAASESEVLLGEGEAILDVSRVAPSDLQVAGADVYVFSCTLSGGSFAETVEGLVEQVPGPLVAVVPSTATAKEMKAILRTGVAGLVRESEIGSNLVATVRAVQGGQLVVPLELGRQIAKPVLSRRQKQVLGLVVLGLSNAEIAAKLHLSEHTVKCHLYSGFRKLGVSSRDEAVATILDPESGLGTGILSISEAESEVATYGHR
jgi:DNA-binding NarL/FixJ family response regulator